VRALVLFALAAACGGGGPQGHGGDDIIDACGGSYCDPLKQTGCGFGEKCTWVRDTSGNCSRLNRCVPDGSAAIGTPCAWSPADPVGYDNCVAGSICSTFGGSAVCRAMCGVGVACSSTQACLIDPHLSDTVGPLFNGECFDACDPLADNDFDGTGSALMRAGTACGSAADIGCYGHQPVTLDWGTQFGCVRDEHYASALRHRTECTMATGCVTTDENGDWIEQCNQGYLPLLSESTMVSTVVCVALCKPLDCYAGNCGSNNVNRLGAAPHRCMTPDAIGAFGSGEECAYWWPFELVGGGFAQSAFSDTLGYCVDRSKYGEAACEDLPLHASGSDEDAARLGCVSSQTAGVMP